MLAARGELSRDKGRWVDELATLLSLTFSFGPGLVGGAVGQEGAVVLLAGHVGPVVLVVDEGDRVRQAARENDELVGEDGSVRVEVGVGVVEQLYPTLLADPVGLVLVGVVGCDGVHGRGERVGVGRRLRRYSRGGETFLSHPATPVCWRA